MVLFLMPPIGTGGSLSTLDSPALNSIPAPLPAASASSRAYDFIFRLFCYNALNLRCPTRITMTFYTFEIVVEKEAEGGGYTAYSPTLPGCFSNGLTIEEARRNIREAIHQHIQSLLAHGQPIPQNEHLVHVEELTVGVP